MIIQDILFCLAAYIFGSIPFGKIIAKKIAHIDITTRGSKNIGATNVARELGIFWGLVTLFLDILKGYLPIILFVAYTPQTNDNYAIVFPIIILAPLIGHQFSIFLRFKGGKGVSTATGIYLAISPFACLVGAFIFILIVYKWDFISLGSTITTSIMPFILIFFCSKLQIICSILIAALICLKHRGNIQRILRGKERKWRRAKSSQ